MNPTGNPRARSIALVPLAASADWVALSLAALTALLAIRVIQKLIEHRSFAHTLERRVDERAAALEAAPRDREAQQAALAESEERFRMLAETANDVVFRFRLTPVAGFEYLSPSVERITGYALEDFYRDPTLAWNRIADDLDEINTAIQGSVNQAVEMRWRNKDGQIIWIELRTAVIRDDSGEPAVFQGIARDVTARRAVLAERSRLASIVESSALGICTADADGRVTSWNHGAEAMLGHTAGEIIGRPLSDLIPAEDAARSAAARARCMAGEPVEPFVARRRHKDGHLVDVSVALAPMPDESGAVTAISAIMHDITDRLRAEEALQLSEARAHIILEAANTALIGTDPGGLIADWNRRAEDLLGWTADEVMGRSVDFLFPEEHRDIHLAALDDVLRTGHGPGVGQPVHLTARRKDGRLLRLEAHVWPAEVEGRRRAYALIMDITERSLAERALRRSEETFRSLIQSAPDAAVIIDDRGRIVLINTAAEHVFGYPLERLLGEHVGMLLPDGLPDSVPSAEMTGRRRDGTTFPVEVRVSSVEAGQETFTAAFIRDITERKLVEEALRRSEKRFRSLLQSAPDAAIIIDGNGRIVLANTEAERLYGYDGGDLVGRDISILVPERYRTTHGHGVQAVTQEATTLGNAGPFELGHARETFARRRDGTEFPVEASLSAFETDDGVFLTALIRDVTQQRAIESTLRRSEQRFRAMFEEGPVGVVVVDDHDTIARANPALTRMLGYDADELHGKTLSDITHPDDRELGKRERSQVLSGEQATSRHQRRFMCRDGTMVWGDLVWSRLSEDGASLLVGLVQDVTKAREAETALRRANDELRRANEAKSVFLARMSHELRTPLSAILISAEMLTTPAYAVRSDEMLQQLGNRILQGGRHLLGLIDDLLDLTRIETGRLQITPVPVSAAGMMSELEGALGPQARRKRVRLELPDAEGLTILADPLRLRQVLINLIGNAIKFTDPGGSVWVGVTLRAGALTISVADTGPGIAAEDIDRVFEPFEQASGRSDGAGLGLAISKQIVEMHGGTIHVESDPGKGSVFLVTLAAANAGPEEPARGAEPGDDAADAETILLVEDDRDIAALMMDVLQNSGYRPIHAATPGEAVQAAADEHPRLILLDIGLGAASGLDIIDDLRAWPGGWEAKILALSAYAMPEEIQRAKDAGCDDYLVKPLGARDIVARIAHWLSVDRAAGSSSGNGQQKPEHDHAGMAFGPDASA